MLSAPYDLFLMDLDARGRMLVAAAASRDAKWFEESGKNWQPLDHLGGFEVDEAVASPDGNLVAIFTQDPSHQGGPYLYDRKKRTASLLASGYYPMAVSYDGRWVCATDNAAWAKSMHDCPLALLPTGGGEPVPLDTHGTDFNGDIRFLPGGRSVLFKATGAHGRINAWILEPGKPPQPVRGLPEDALALVPSLPGTLVAYGRSEGVLACSIGTWAWHPLEALGKRWYPLDWDDHDHALVLTSAAFMDSVFQSLQGVDPRLSGPAPRWIWRMGSTTPPRPAKSFAPPWRYPNWRMVDGNTGFVPGSGYLREMDMTWDLFLVEKASPP